MVVITRLIPAASARLPGLAIIGAVALLWASAAPVHACSCEPPQAHLVWPSAGSQAVSLEPDIVVRVPLSSDHGPTEVRLIGPKGARVELTERRRERQNESYGCADETVFLAPVAPLSADTRYALEFDGSFDAGGEEQASARAFTTGSTVVAALEPTQLSVPFDRLNPGA